MASARYRDAVSIRGVVVPPCPETAHSERVLNDTTADMPKCPSCDKEVYFGAEGPQNRTCWAVASRLSDIAVTHLADAFTKSDLEQSKSDKNNNSAAEKVTSLGKDWHRPCLKCAKCRKTLTPGSHAEHDKKPYCTKPCYSALFGPKGT
ncbi:Cysteine-rich protein 1 [Merluccius polli]|uniref:Cysteine-rich protein 1 n=1 Tax=Merluccius polli TaxID=89951 RepID=A0AA47MXJ2_MERPO|nr:Cysteine-rich protein 1 [Merluccius polli]